MLETIYNDFVTKMLPAVQEGLVITKDYFFDLFGRYVKYLIIVDSLLLAFCLAILLTLVLLWKKFLKSEYFEGEAVFFAIMGTIFITAFTLIGVFSNANHLIQDLNIPEVRVYQELKPLMNK